MKKIALAQMHIDYENAENNISTARDMLNLAAKKHCDCIVFPELWSTGFRLENHQKFSIINRSLLDRVAIHFLMEMISRFLVPI